MGAGIGDVGVLGESRRRTELEGKGNARDTALYFHDLLPQPKIPVTEQLSRPLRVSMCSNLDSSSAPPS